MADYSFEVLVVGGGGGGGGINNEGTSSCGGGGGGGVKEQSLALPDGSYAITVGALGAGGSNNPGSNGGASSIGASLSVSGGGGELASTEQVRVCMLVKTEALP